MNASRRPYFQLRPEGDDRRPRLACFPFAGGSNAFFSDWVKQLADVAQVLPVHLPGRGSRFGEPLIDDAGRLADAIADAFLALPDPARPAVFYGHSMGTVLAYETARRVVARGGALRGLILTGRGAPHLPRSKPPRSHWSDEDLVAELRNLGGTPAEVFASPELLSLFLPALRSDFRLIETYGPQLAALQPKLPLPARVIGGADDRPSEADLAAWGEVLAGPVQASLWPGGHFFINDAMPRLLDEVRERVAAWSGRVSG